MNFLLKRHSQMLIHHPQVEAQNPLWVIPIRRILRQHLHHRMMKGMFHDIWVNKQFFLCALFNYHSPFFRNLDNLRYAWCFNNRDMPPTNQSHKISPAFDVFCTDRLCSRRRAKTPENHSKDEEELCCGFGGLTIGKLRVFFTRRDD